MMIDDIPDKRQQNSQRNSTKHLLPELLGQTHEMAGWKGKYSSQKGHKIHRMESWAQWTQWQNCCLFGCL